MASPGRIHRPLLAAVFCLGPLAASAQQPPPGLREDLDAVSAALERAVRQVSRPGAYALAASATRAYVLPGMGAVFVLPPRALPVRRVKAVENPTSRALAEAAASLQESLRRAQTPDQRAQIERSLFAVRQAQSALRGAPVPIPRPAWNGPLPMPDLAADMEAMMAAHAHQAEEMERRFDEQWAAEMQALGAQTDAFRAEALRMQREAERALQEQLQAWPELSGVPAIAAPPEPADAPAPPAAPVHPAVPSAPAAPAPRAAAAPPVPHAPPPPPWSLWFEPEVAETGDADTVVRGVRTAVLGALEGQARRFPHLGPEESVVVAVDFLARGPAVGARSRTLVLRVRKKDLVERQAGRLAAEEFQRRVQTAEY